MSLYDPLLEAEKQNTTHTKIKISRTKTLYSTKKTPFIHNIWKQLKFLLTYCLLSASIFGIMMVAMNFGAYSSRFMHWINPDVYAKDKEDIHNILSQSQGEINNETTNEEKQDREMIEEKIAKNNPEMVYSRNYSEEALLSNIPLQSAEKTSFVVTPQENRIIIPRLGKNIPLLDVTHDEKASFTEMHEIFMEELKKGIVRYPGTALPGEIGNAFIFGHSSNYPWVKSDYNDVFALLDTLQNGDEIIVYYNQKKFIYSVTDRSIVKPGDTKALLARDPNKKEISLMTCWPIGTTLERLIIFGELKETK